MAIKKGRARRRGRVQVEDLYRSPKEEKTSDNLNNKYCWYELYK